MSRLSLDAFKAQVDTSKTEELENLSGGILGACHSPSGSCLQELAEGIGGILVEYYSSPYHN